MINLLKKFAQSRARDVAGLIVVICLIWIVRRLAFRGTGIYDVMWFWVGLTAIVVVAFIAWKLYTRAQDKSRGQKTKRIIVEGAEDDSISASPSAQDDLNRIHSSFVHAVELLEQSVPRRERSSVLYKKPWIMIVGPPSDGKTTSVRNAGIEWPHDPRTHETGGGFARSIEAQGIGGTKTCNWFFAREAIILDTAGRWQARDMGEIDEDQWNSFLGKLKETRPRRPINGVIAMCSVERLLTDQQDLERRARETRKQLDEMMSRLETHAPVYLIFNKFDIIHGFLESFADLDKKSRQQVWGFTRQYRPKVRQDGRGLESELPEILKDVDHEIDRLQQVLHERRLHRMLDPGLNAGQRAALFVFPSEFKELSERFRRFIEIAFRQNESGHNPALRGVYFTSATQSGQPIFEFMKEVAGELDIPADRIPLPPRTSLDTYFLRDLFHNVVFQDSGLAGRFRRSWYDRTRLWITGVTTALTLLVGVWMTVSFAVNSTKNERLAERVEHVRSIKTQLPSRVLPALDSLRVAYQDYLDVSWPFGVFQWFFGRDKLDPLSSIARDEIAVQLDTHFVQPALGRCEQILSLPTIDNFTTYISAYRTYVYLTDSPNRSLVDHEGIAAFMITLATSTLAPDNRAHSLRSMLDSLVASYWSIHEYSQRPPPNESVMSTAQHYLRDRWDWDNIVNEVIDDCITPDGSYPPREMQFFGNVGSVPFAFTSEGWQQQVRPRLQQTLRLYQSDRLLSKVVGEKLNSGSSEDLDQAYCTRCQEEWRNFFRSLTLTRSYDIKAFYNAIIGFQSPVKRLIHETASLTHFDPKCPSHSFFTGLQHLDSVFEKYSASLVTAGTAILTQFNEPGGCVQAYIQSRQAVSSSEISATHALSALSLDNDLQRLLDRPFDIAEADARQLLVGCINRYWRDDVLSQVGEGALECFPFSMSGYDCGSQIREILGPDGPLAGFRQNTFAPAEMHVSTTDDYRQFESMRRSINRFLSGTDGVSLVLSSATVGPQINWVEVTVGYASPVRFSHGGDATVELPVPFSGARIKIIAARTNEERIEWSEFEGNWATLKLLQSASISGNTAVLSRDGLSLGFRVQFGGNNNPLDLFRQFRPPSIVCN